MKRWNLTDQLPPTLPVFKNRQDKLDAALHLLKNSKCSIRAAGRHVGIHESSLRGLLKSNTKTSASIDSIDRLVMQKSGRKKAIPIKDEEALATAVCLKAKQGFGLTKADITDLVRNFIGRHKEQETELGAHLQKYCKFKVKKMVVANHSLIKLTYSNVFRL